MRRFVLLRMYRASGASFRTMETVLGEKPARPAISRMVTIAPCCFRRGTLVLGPYILDNRVNCNRQERHDDTCRGYRGDQYAGWLVQRRRQFTGTRVIAK